MSGEPGTDSQQQDALVIEWQGSYSTAFQRCLNLLGVLGADLVDADPNHGYLAGRCGPTLAGIGIDIRIDFETHLEQISLRVQSTPRLKLLDWGAAERFLVRFREAWDRIPDSTLTQSDVS